MLYDIVGLIILILDIWAIVQIIQSSEAPTGKVIWALVIVVLPVLGLLLWYLAGPGGKRLPVKGA